MNIFAFFPVALVAFLAFIALVAWILLSIDYFASKRTDAPDRCPHCGQLVCVGDPVSDQLPEDAAKLKKEDA